MQDSRVLVLSGMLVVAPSTLFVYQPLDGEMQTINSIQISNWNSFIKQMRPINFKQVKQVS